ncbi:hypothetical protein [Candidatus Chlamydia corallus]|uniref:hypothetical protein n=1 Tax=Candidatus Chlamydia corallus TaxID=2038470 RepID=UPI000C2FBB15|nr:hypothetical protein [Candidatus Chlamydia corallus]
MPLNQINSQRNQSEQIASTTSRGPKINPDRKIFAGIVTQLVMATLMILAGIIVLFTIVSGGLSVPLCGIIGTFAVTLGIIIFMIGLTILVRKSLGIEQKDEYSNFSKINNPTTQTSSPISKFCVTCSTISIVLGVSLLVGAAVSAFFFTGYLQLALCAGLVCLGTAFFVSGIAGMFPRSLATQKSSASDDDSQSDLLIGIGEERKTASDQRFYNMALVRAEDGTPISIRLTPHTDTT